MHPKKARIQEAYSPPNPIIYKRIMPAPVTVAPRMYMPMDQKPKLMFIIGDPTPAAPLDDVAAAVPVAEDEPLPVEYVCVPVGEATEPPPLVPAALISDMQLPVAEAPLVRVAMPLKAQALEELPWLA